LSILVQKLNLTGAPAGVYTGYLELDGDIGSIGPDGLGLAVFKPIAYDSSGNLKAADATSDYIVAAAVGGYLGHVATASLTILLNGAPVGGVLRFDLIESSPGIVDIKALYLQGKVQPVTPGVLANLTDLLAQATTLVPQMQQALADTAQATALSVQERALSAQARALLLSTQDGSLLRYPTNAARNAASPADGLWGWAADVNNYRHRESGAWVSYDPAPPAPTSDPTSF